MQNKTNKTEKSAGENPVVEFERQFKWKNQLPNVRVEKFTESHIGSKSIPTIRAIAQPMQHTTCFVSRNQHKHRHCSMHWFTLKIVKISKNVKKSESPSATQRARFNSNVCVDCVTYETLSSWSCCKPRWFYHSGSVLWSHSRHGMHLVLEFSRIFVRNSTLTLTTTRQIFCKPTDWRPSNSTVNSRPVRISFNIIIITINLNDVIHLEPISTVFVNAHWLDFSRWHSPFECECSLVFRKCYDKTFDFLSHSFAMSFGSQSTHFAR